MSEPWALDARTGCPDATRALAAALATESQPGDLVLLIGGLGAGKTVFAQGFAAALGVEGPVTSPTFTLVRQYRCAGDGPVRQLLHADLYRLDHLAEVADLALGELLEGGAAVALVEWGDAGAPVFGESALEVTLTPGDDDDARCVHVSGRGERFAARRAGFAAALAPFGPEQW